jgi:hypothetical protein
MLYSNFHWNLHPGASRGVPATKSPELTAEGFFTSGIAEHNEAANGPRAHRKQFIFQFPFSNFRLRQRNYFGA